MILHHAQITAGIIRGLMKDKSPLAPKEMENLPAKKLKRMGYHPNSKTAREWYANFGEMVCSYHHGGVPRFLRLVVDILEGKLPRRSWYDDAIKSAYKETLAFWRWYRPDDPVPAPPFFVFLKFFRRQNPKMTRRNKEGDIENYPSERSLRRALIRLGFPLTSKRERIVLKPNEEYYAWADVEKAVERTKAGELPGLHELQGYQKPPRSR